MKKTVKVIITIALISMMIFLSITPVFAAVKGGVDPSQLTGDDQANTTKMTSIGNQVITIVSVAGSIISVVVLIVLGIKYMMGSAEEKAEYKKTLMPYIIGAAFVFAASAIAGIIFNFANSIA